jgi:hypothetical protein
MIYSLALARLRQRCASRRTPAYDDLGASEPDKSRSSTCEDCLRPRSVASRRGRYRCLPERPTPGRPASAADRAVCPARRSLPREPPNGEPPNRTRTCLPPVRHEGHLRDGGACSHAHEFLWREYAQAVVQFIRCPHPQALELVSSLRSGLIIAERRAARKAPIISTQPSPLFGTPNVSPVNTARAPLSASEGPDLRRRCELRCRRLGRSTSSTSTPSAFKWRAIPAP